MGGKRRSKTAMRIVPSRPSDNDHTKYAERELFAQWLITPKPDREPKTQAALAVELGVTAVTLSNWKGSKTFMRDVFQAAGRDIKLDWFQPMLQHQFEIATSNLVKPSESTQAAKFVLGVMTKTMELDDAIEDALRPIEGMNLDELRSELADIVDLIDDKIDLQI